MGLVDVKQEIQQDEILHYPWGEWCPLERPAMELVILPENTTALWTVSGVADLVRDFP